MKTHVYVLVCDRWGCHAEYRAPVGVTRSWVTALSHARAAGWLARDTGRRQHLCPSCKPTGRTTRPVITTEEKLL